MREELSKSEIRDIKAEISQMVFWAESTAEKGVSLKDGNLAKDIERLPFQCKRIADYMTDYNTVPMTSYLDGLRKRLCKLIQNSTSSQPEDPNVLFILSRSWRCIEDALREQRVWEEDTQQRLETLLQGRLRGDETAEYYIKAIDAGFIKMTAIGLEWMQIGKTGGDTQLAYFCGKVYGYEYNGINGNEGDQVPYEDLEKLFGVKRMDRALNRAHNVTKPQYWRIKIDKLFD